MKRENISKLRTEQSNPAAQDLDLKSALQIATIINREDEKVAAAVGRALPQIATAINWIAEAMRNSGRLIYVGTGTSGRLGALDASECQPTFGVRPETVRFVIAGGERALAHATEVSEDSRESGRRDIAKLKPTKKDVVVGIAASGRTPYTIAAVQHARWRGAKTVAVVCNQNSPLERAASLGIAVEVGPEVVAGSSRMKAGTAQKLVLNMLSTAAMARAGYVFGNQMVNVHTKNSKLVERGIGILQKITRATREAAIKALEEARGNVPVALITMQSGVAPAAARKALAAEHGNVRRALQRAIKGSSKAYAASAANGKALTIRKRRNG